MYIICILLLFFLNVCLIDAVREMAVQYFILIFYCFFLLFLFVFLFYFNDFFLIIQHSFYSH